MVVAVPIVRVVQVTADKIVDMIAMGDRRMSTIGSVLVGRIVFRTSVRRTGCRVCRANLQNVFVVVPIVVVVQMTIVEIIDVVLVTNRRVSAVFAVLVVVMLVNVVAHSVILSSAGFLLSHLPPNGGQMQKAPPAGSQRGNSGSVNQKYSFRATCICRGVFNRSLAETSCPNC